MLVEEADGEGGSTYTHHMKDALFMMPTAAAEEWGRILQMKPEAS